MLRETFEPVPAVRGHHHMVSLVLQRCGEHFDDSELIVDD
jgi:hypothetical protein